MCISCIEGSNSLSGGIPTEIGYFSDAKFIRLGKNHFSTIALLKAMAKDTYLRLNNLWCACAFINVGNDNVTGSLPSELGNLASLEFMFLGKCCFLTNFIALRTLVQLFVFFDIKIEGTKLTGEIPTELGKLGGLKAFKISGGSLSGSLPTEIGLLGGLINLDFGTKST